MLDLVKTPEDRAIVELQLNRVAIGRPVIGPPDVPADRMAMLRAAFSKAVDDPEFLQGGHAAAAGDRSDERRRGAALINRLYQTPAAVLERMRKIVQVTAE